MPDPPPTTSVNPGARILELRQAPLHTGLSSVMHSHRLSSCQISDRTDEISCTSVVCVPGSKLDAMRTLSRNCAKENQSYPRTQSPHPSSQIVKTPRSLIFLLFVLIPQSVCKSALWALKGPPIRMLSNRCHREPAARRKLFSCISKNNISRSCAWGKCQNPWLVASPALSSLALSRLIDHITWVYRHRRLRYSQSAASVNVVVTCEGLMLSNCFL